MSSTERRSPIAFQVTLQRVGNYGLRAALTRITALAVVAAAMVTTTTPWYAWVIVVIAAFASYLSASDNYYTDRQDSDARPREPIAAASLRYNIATLGLNRPNVPGLLEMGCYVPLAILGPYLLTDASTLVRLVSVAGALVYIGSCVCAVFLDPAFYNPTITMPAFFEQVRPYVGPISALLALAVIAPAPSWDDQSRAIAALMCVFLAALQIRLRETDRALVLARGFSDNEQIKGRQAIAEQIHSKVGAPLDALARYVDRNKLADRDLYDQYRLAVGGYRELLALEEAADIDVDWPGLLAGRLLQIAAEGDTQFAFDFSEMALSRTDRLTAHLVLDDFATNARKAGATLCTLTLTYEAVGNRFDATAVDDGRPIRENAWMREGGGLRRLDKHLTEMGGGITYEVLPDGTKKIQGTWQSITEPDTTAAAVLREK